MLDFAHIIRKNTVPSFLKEDFLTRLSSLIPVGPVELKTWKSADSSCSTFVWHSNVSPFVDLTKCADLSERNDISFYQGYAIENANVVKDINEFKNHDISKLTGDFFHFRVSLNGIGKISRSPISQYQIYYGENESIIVISSRATIAASIIEGKSKLSIDPNFVRWVSSYAIAANDYSLFKGIKFLQLNEEISLFSNKIEIVKRSPSFIFSAEKNELYHENRKVFWDQSFERFLSTVKCLDLSEDYIDFPLSGGKDSRLLLALIIGAGYKDRLKRIFTNGPGYSPEVRSAQLVCHELGLMHEYVDNTAKPGGNSQQHTNNRLFDHLFITEGEMSPVDLCWQRKITNRTQLHGQEAGLRNIAGNRAFEDRPSLFKWFYSHLGKGDKSGIFNSGKAEENVSEIENFIDYVRQFSVPWSEIPSLHRIWYRGARWVGRTSKYYNSMGFAPYLFLNSEIISITMSAGYTSRINEEFHFEMMRRLNKNLITLPFSGQTWSQEVISSSGIDFSNSSPFKWPENVDIKNTKHMFETLHRNWDATVDFIVSKSKEATSAVIDFDKLRGIDKERLDVSQYQNLWQLVQCTLAENIDDWSEIDNLDFRKSIALPIYN